MKKILLLLVMTVSWAFYAQETITTSAVPQNAYCQGLSFDLEFTAEGTYNAGNVFSAQMSDSSGDFTSPTTVGSLNATTSGSVTVTIPTTTPTGAGYRFRIVSSDPEVTGSDNGSDIAVNTTPTANQPENMLACTSLGSAQFFLTEQDPEILNGQNPLDFVISYYTTLEDAENNSNPITNPNSYVVTETTTIYARVTNVSATDCYAVTSFELELLPSAPVDILDDVTACDSFTLPELTNGNYFTDLNGTGTPFFAGDVITESVTLYIFNHPDAPAGCSAQSQFDITVEESQTYYADTDNDGFGDPLNATTVCSQPEGYVLDNTDCDDTNDEVNPNGTEIPFNGLDDDCNGTIDEGSQLLSQVLPSQCGTTLNTISSLIGAVSFGSPVDGYRFKVVNTTTSEEQVFDSNVPHCYLTQFAQYDYATTYIISVQLRYNGQWLNYYGPECEVSTPNILSVGGGASVIPALCGSQLATINSPISTNSLNGVTGYRFRITDSANDEIQVIDRSVHWFTLTMLESYLYGRTYTVEVAMKTTGDYSGYGQPCQITTPPVPQLVNCGGDIPTPGTLLHTLSLDRVSSYRFQITNLGTSETIVVDRLQHYFAFSHVSTFVLGAQYSISIAVMTAGDWSDFSAPCIVTSPTMARDVVVDDQLPMIALRASAYPNPYSASFALDMEPATQDNLLVKIYDMTGRLVEEQEIASDAVNSAQFGDKYPSGVYNVIVRQGNSIKTLRVIKR